MKCETVHLAFILEEWHPGLIPDEMPPSRLVRLLSDQYEKVFEDLEADLDALRKGGAS